jgi:BMFP domain-containing protein YqiC
MPADNPLFDDLSRMASGALGALSGVRGEVETRMREQFERALSRMNLVRREEFDAVQAMAAKARDAQEALEKRVAELEARLGAAGEGGPRPTPRRSARPRPPLRKPKPAPPL